MQLRARTLLHSTVRRTLCLMEVLLFLLYRIRLSQNNLLLLSFNKSHGKKRCTWNIENFASCYAQPFSTETAAYYIAMRKRAKKEEHHTASEAHPVSLSQLLFHTHTRAHKTHTDTREADEQPRVGGRTSCSPRNFQQQQQQKQPPMLKAIRGVIYLRWNSGKIVGGSSIKISDQHI